VKIRRFSDKAPVKRRTRTSKAALPALVAAGSGLAVGSAAALELGELQVQSTLGQPLRASIAYALSPNEIIDERCIAVHSAGSDLPGLHNAAVRVSKGVISITGTSPVMEPMLSASIVVSCPYSAHVSRNYLMFIDPQERVVPVVQRRSQATALAAGAPAPAARSAPSPAPATTPVAQNSRYRVQPGDSLSGIVGRLERLDVASTAAMAAILDANPGAFIDGNPDRLKAGSWLDIPSFVGGAMTAPAHTAPASVPRDFAREATTPTAAHSYQGAETLEPDAIKQIPATEFLPDVPQTGSSAATETATAPADTVETVVEAPVETVVEAVVDTGAEAPVGESDYSAAYADLVAGDVVIEEPAATATAPAEPAVAPARVVKPGAGTRIVGTPEPDGFSWNWLIWAAVGVISTFGAYLMFWPTLRERFGSKPVGADDRIPPQAERVAPITLPESEMTVQEIRPTYENVDFDLSDDSPTEENLVLDADLIDGTGFDESADVDVNRDFGFAATMDLDMELPETAAIEDSAPETDIIPPPERPEDLVVSSEVLPEEDGDEYDISMIVDATKMPDPAEVTERDLRAVPLDDTGKTLINDDYTIIDHIGQDILAQDYEDELTATQMLHAEIEKAAAELAETIGEDEPTAVASLDDDPTAIASLDDEADDDGGRIVGFDDDTSIEMQLTNLSELDLTATLEAQNDDNGDDLDVTASIEADDKTVEMPRDRDGARAR
jgi:hypothetical protein